MGDRYSGMKRVLSLHTSVNSAVICPVVFVLMYIKTKGEQTHKEENYRKIYRITNDVKAYVIEFRKCKVIPLHPSGRGTDVEWKRNRI